MAFVQPPMPPPAAAGTTGAQVRLVEEVAHQLIAASLATPKVAGWADILTKATACGVGGMLADEILGRLVAEGRLYEPVLGVVAEVPP